MGKLLFESDLISSAVNGNKDAIATMFKSFICADEEILDIRYFGSHGILWGKVHSFVCLTDKRIASLEYGHVGNITYQDAFIEDVNSGVIYQPSILKLYVVSVILAITIYGIILIPFWIQYFYKLNKSGMVWAIREGISIYAFANRSKINEVNSFWRNVSNVRSHQVYNLK